MNKHPFKSKIILLCAGVILLIASISLLGIGEKNAGPTYRELGEANNVFRIETAKWLAVIFAAGAICVMKESEIKK